jgi:cell division protease FtsH
VFLGREIVSRRHLSESVAEKVDTEVKRLLDEAYHQAMKTLRENRKLLDTISEALLDRETLDREEVLLLARGEPLPEAKLVKQAREFAEALRRDSGRLTPAGDQPDEPRADEPKEEVAVPAEADPDPTR